MPKNRIIIIDDNNANLLTTRQAILSLKKENILPEKVELHLAGFEEGERLIKELNPKEVLLVAIDLFEGKFNPRGAELFLEAFDRGFSRVAITTDGERHNGKLGAVRYFLENAKASIKDENCPSLEIIKRYKELTPQNFRKRGLTFFFCLAGCVLLKENKKHEFAAQYAFDPNGFNKRSQQQWKIVLTELLQKERYPDKY